MAKGTYYDLLEVAPDVSPQTIAAVLRARLTVAAPEEREQLLLARDTLLDASSRESYDRLNGITPTPTFSDVKREKREALAAYEADELWRREASAYAEWVWAVHLVALGLSVGIWLLTMVYLVPPIATKMSPIFQAFQWGKNAPMVVGAFFTVLFLTVGWMIANVYTKAMSITMRFMGVCFLLAILLFAANSAILGAQMAWGIRIIAMVAVMLCAFMFVRYLGIRQLRTVGEPPVPPERRR